jgi:hypothetical protein
MNLADLRSKVKSITDYSPELATYNVQMDDLINDSLYSIWTSKRWRFAQVRDIMKVYPDLSSSTVTATLTNGSRQVIFSAAVQMITAEQTSGPFSSQSFSTAYGSSGSAYEGEIFASGGREYNILKVVSTTEIRLDEQYRGPTGATFDWKVKKRFYDLPDDCLELLNISQRDVPAAGGQRPPHGKLSGLSKRREEELNLREDYTATFAECYIDTPPVNVPPGEKLILIADDSPAGPTIPSLYYVELCWAFHYFGAKIGPLSEPLLYRTTSTPGFGHAITVGFRSFDDKLIVAQAFALGVDRVPNKYEGLRKVLFFNQNLNPTTGKRLGLPCWRAITGGGATGDEGGAPDSGKPILVSDEFSQITLQHINQFNPGNPRYAEWDGSHPRIRPYPRIVGSDFFNAQLVGEISAAEEYFRRLEIRYFKKPTRMVLSTDTPQMPHEFSQLVVYGVLEDVYNKSGNFELANAYRKKIDKSIVGLERRYIDSIDTNFQRGSFSVGQDAFTLYDPNSLKLAP